MAQSLYLPSHWLKAKLCSFNPLSSSLCLYGLQRYWRSTHAAWILGNQQIASSPGCLYYTGYVQDITVKSWELSWQRDDVYTDRMQRQQKKFCAHSGQSSIVFLSKGCSVAKCLDEAHAPQCTIDLASFVLLQVTSSESKLRNQMVNSTLPLPRVCFTGEQNTIS